MNSMRKFLGFLMVSMLVAVALPANAAKTISIAPPVSVAEGSPQNIDVKFTNTGNSTFNSLELNWTNSPQFTVISAKIPSGVTVLPQPGLPGTQKAVFTNTGPIGTSITVTLTANVTSVCGSAAQITWGAKSWTGSPTSPSSDFLLTPAPIKTNLPTANCLISFAQQPVSAALSGGVLAIDGFPVKVLTSPAAFFEGKTVTLTATPTGASLALPTPGPVTKTISGGYATFPGLTLTGPAGNYNLVATTSVSGAPTATSAPIAISDSTGTLDCLANPNGGPDAIPQKTNSAGTKVAGNRGINKDGSPCKLVVYDLALIGDRTFQFKWDTTNQGSAAFSYQADFAPTSVDSTTGLPKPLQLAWTATGIVPNYVQGRTCLSPNLPSPYGTLTSDGGATIVVAVAGTPPAVPFPIAIGSERLTVTGVAGPTWTVNRGVGGTTPVTHAGSSPVMNTPFPLDASNMLMPMCIADYFYAIGSDGKVHVKAKIFDQGDGWVDQP